MHVYVKKAVAGLAVVALTLLPAASSFADGGRGQTATPIKHLVVIFQENVSFDWLKGERIGQGSFDALANSITQMFDFSSARDGEGDGDGNQVLFLDPSSGKPINQNH